MMIRRSIEYPLMTLRLPKSESAKEITKEVNVCEPF